MPEISASTNIKGLFVPGTIGTLIIRIVNLDGSPLTPDTISVTLRKTDTNEVILTEYPDKVDAGFFVKEWNIPISQPIGDYQATWMYTVDTDTYLEVQDLIVSQNASTAPSGVYSDQALALIRALEHYIRCPQSIPVYSEQAKPTKDRTIYFYTFKNWNQTRGTTIYRNNKILTSDDYEINYFTGEVIFKDVQTQYDKVEADYNFRWFTDSDLFIFICNAISSLNTYPPVSPSFSINRLPGMWIPSVLSKAATDALRQFMLCIQFQETQQIFGGSERAQQVFSNMETLKKNYEGQYIKEFENKKFGAYPKGVAVATSEYTLPGGRSLAPSTYVNFEDVGNITIQESYDLFHLGKKLKVLSQDINGDLCFSDVSMIFKSGIKKICKLTTEKGFVIESSKEHLFYCNDSYIPLEEIKIGDKLVTSDGNSVFEDRVKETIVTDKEVEMYDIDVPETKNLFANGIKCHNSRWFRYLFNGSGS